MVEVRERAELGLEAREVGRVHAEERLQRDVLLAIAIEGLVDGAHAAGAEVGDDAEALGPLEIQTVWLHPRPPRHAARAGADAGTLGPPDLTVTRERRPEQA